MSIRKKHPQLFDESVMPVRWNNEANKWVLGKGYDDQSWYEFLAVKPETLVEQCSAHGYNKPETAKILDVWGDRFHKTVPRRKPTKDEDISKHRRTRDLPEHVRKQIEEFQSTVNKMAQAESYEKCRLHYLEDNLPLQENNLCRDLVCQDPLLSSDPDFPKKMKRCKDLGHKCPDTSEVVFIDPKQMTHVPNCGMGDCLFIATAHYLELARRLGEAMGEEPFFPIPGKPPKIDKPLTYYNVTETRLKLEPLSNQLRAQVVQWFRDNRKMMLKHGRRTEEELALLALNEPSILPRREYDKLQIPPQPHEVKSPNRQELANILSDIDQYVMNHQDQEQAMKYVHRIVDQFFELYVTVMSRTQTYGGQPEITALSYILNKHILVLQYMENVLVSNMGALVPGATGTIYINHNANVTQKSGGQHYEVWFPLPSMVPSKGNNSCPKEQLAMSSPSPRSRPSSRPRRLPVDTLSNEEIVEKFQELLKNSPLNERGQPLLDKNNDIIGLDLYKLSSLVNKYVRPKSNLPLDHETNIDDVGSTLSEKLLSILDPKYIGENMTIGEALAYIDVNKDDINVLNDIHYILQEYMIFPFIMTAYAVGLNGMAFGGDIIIPGVTHPNTLTYLIELLTDEESDYSIMFEDIMSEPLIREEYDVSEISDQLDKLFM
jgi:hypothetical protein